MGELLLVEHDPVITIPPRPRASGHLLASEETLEAEGISVQPTDRGGDITYHGPGQLVCYPIIDLEATGLRLHAYLRAMEAAVIDVCAALGVVGERDESATGVWIDPAEQGPGVRDAHGQPAKICAMGVRVRRWITLHGLALNVSTDLSHFAHIIPCGLAGRPVTSLRELLGERAPTVEAVKPAMVEALTRRLAGSDLQA